MFCQIWLHCYHFILQFLFRLLERKRLLLFILLISSALFALFKIDGPHKKVIFRFFCPTGQILANRGPDSRLVLKANNKALISKLNRSQVIKLMDQGRVTWPWGKYRGRISHFRIFRRVITRVWYHFYTRHIGPLFVHFKGIWILLEWSH